jgi:hypothetical protein
MSGSTESTSLAALRHDLNADVRTWGKQQIGELSTLIRRDGLVWMEEYLEGILNQKASGSR